MPTDLPPLHDQSGDLTYSTGVQPDTTAQQMALHYERERFHNTLNTLPQAFISHDCQWTVTYVDTAGATAFGHLADDLMGQSLKAVFSEADRSPVIQAARRVMKTGVSGHISTSSDSLAKGIEATVYVAAEFSSVHTQTGTAGRQRTRRVLH